MIEIVEGDLGCPEHANAVILLMDEYSRDPMGAGKALPSHVRENLVSELKRRDAIHIIIAFSAGVPAGLVVCIEGFSTFACRTLLNIHDVIVSRDHRGQGVCKRMLEEAELLARKIDCCKITLEVLEGNAIAQNAYKSFGFSGYELDPEMGRAMYW